MSRSDVVRGDSVVSIANLSNGVLADGDFPLVAPRRAETFGNSLALKMNVNKLN